MQFRGVHICSVTSAWYNGFSLVGLVKCGFDNIQAALQRTELGWYRSRAYCAGFQGGEWELQPSVASPQWFAFGENNQIVGLGVFCGCVVVVWFSLLLGCFFPSVFVNFKLGNILNKYYLIKNEFWSSVLVQFPRKPKQMFLSLDCHSFANLIQT